MFEYLTFREGKGSDRWCVNVDESVRVPPNCVINSGNIFTPPSYFVLVTFTGVNRKHLVSDQWIAPSLIYSPNLIY